MFDYQKLFTNMSELCQIESIEDKPAPNAPFGIKVRQALDYVLNLAQDFGFQTFDCKGYAGGAVYNSKDCDDYEVGILSHLDVVPVGKDWTYKQGEIVDGKIYGRGVADDKGPTLACLYALNRIKEENIQLKHPIKLIWGCNEETGNKCMEYYAEHNKMPDIGFSPDADFPMITCEKNIVQLLVTFNLNIDKCISIVGGERSNVVCDRCEVVMEQGSYVSDVRPIEDNGKLKFVFEGKAAHAMQPFMGDNAIWKALKFIANNNLAGEQAKLIADMLTDDSTTKLGVYMNTDNSGDTTLNIGTVRYENGKLVMCLDMRCPVGQDIEQLPKTIKSKVNCDKIEVLYYAPYLYAAHDGKLVKTLSKVYTEVTNKPTQYIISGGGTYARKMPNGIAFGPMDLDIIDNKIHQTDEVATLDQIKEWCEIYYRAIIALGNIDKDEK